jgi:hypothetical protein
MIQLMEDLHPTMTEPNPNFGHRIGYVSTFLAKDMAETLSGLLVELYALKAEGYEPIDIEVETVPLISDSKYRIIVTVENKERFTW